MQSAYYRVPSVHRVAFRESGLPALAGSCTSNRHKDHLCLRNGRSASYAATFCSPRMITIELRLGRSFRLTGKPEATAKIRQSSGLPTNRTLLNQSPFFKQTSDLRNLAHYQANLW